MLPLLRQGLVEYTTLSSGVRALQDRAGNLLGASVDFVADNFLLVVVALVTAVLVLGFTSARVR